MRTIRLSNSSAAAWTFVLAIGLAGCGGPNREADNEAAIGSPESPAATSADANNQTRRTLTGCLQQAEGGDDFILTQVNEQPGPVATSGDSNESTAVQERQQQAAARSYRLSGGPDNLREMVGHEVRVTGTIDDRGDVQSGEASRDVDEDDLASFEVASAESIANACGNAQERGSSKPGPRRQ